MELNKKKQQRKPLSLYPLLPEQALAAFMNVDPIKVKKAEKRLAKKKLIK